MQNSFAKGMLFGSVLGASMTKIMDGDMLRSRRKMMRTGKNIWGNSAKVMGKLINAFR